MIEFIRALPDQIKGALELGKYVKLEPPKNIVFSGMGGSGIPGNIIKDLLSDCKVPITLVKDYHLPGWVNQDSLVFCISYSGNTEETINCVREALKRKSQIVLITSNGKLSLIAQEANIKNVIKVPYRMPPRAAIAFFVFPVLTILNNLKLANISNAEINDTITSLNKAGYDEKAQELAHQLKDRVPLIYTTQNYEGVALRWKQSLNENAKIHAFYNVFPELDHNELLGYKRPRKEFFVLILSDEDEDKQMKKRIDLTKDMIRQAGNEVVQINIKGTSKLAKIFTAIYLGDLTSYYLAKLHNVDPLNTDLLDDLKKRL